MSISPPGTMVPPQPRGGCRQVTVGHHSRPTTYRHILCRVYGWSLACCRSPKDLGHRLTCIHANCAMHTMQISKIAEFRTLGPMTSIRRAKKFLVYTWGATPLPVVQMPPCDVGLDRWLARLSSVSRKRGIAQLQWHHVCTPSLYLYLAWLQLWLLPSSRLWPCPHFGETP